MKRNSLYGNECALCTNFTLLNQPSIVLIGLRPLSHWPTILIQKRPPKKSLFIFLSNIIFLCELQRSTLGYFFLTDANLKRHRTLQVCGFKIFQNATAIFRQRKISSQYWLTELLLWRGPYRGTWFYWLFFYWFYLLHVLNWTTWPKYRWVFNLKRLNVLMV